MKNEQLSLQLFDSEAMRSQVNEMLIKHGLDFRIEKIPMVGIIGETKYPSNYFGLLNSKSGEIINTTKASYHVSQNDEVLGLVVRGMRNFGELSIQKAGSLNGGRKTFIQLEINGLAKVGDDVIKKYVTLIDSNDGSTGLSIGIGDLTMSCQNQFFRFYKRGEMKLKHSSSLEGKLREIPNLIQLALNESMKQIEIYNRFISTAASKELADGLVRELLGVDRLTVTDEHSTKSVNAMNELYAHIGREMSAKGQNLWGLHSGVTSWTTHAKSAPRRENGQIESLMTGTNYRTNMDSFNFALGYIGATDLVLA